MQLFRIIPLEKDLWAINEIDKTVMYVINGTERALLLDTGLGLTDLKEEVLKLCGEKSVQSGMGISLIWEIKNLKFWKFPVIPWGVLHCLRRRKDGFLQEISCSPGKCGDI